MADYTTEAKMNRYLSTVGINHWSDHNYDGQNDDDVVSDVITQSTQEIDLHLHSIYELADLASSTLLQSWATVLACKFLCLRRGNPVPESLEIEFQRIMEKLQKLKEGALTLPGIDRKSNGVPTFSNLTVDRRYHREKVRVTERNSSPQSSVLEQDIVADHHGWPHG